METHLNVDYLEQLFATCIDPFDREFVSMIRAGVSVGAELEEQIVICPNLLSLYETEGSAAGIDAAADALDELVQRGWYRGGA